MAIFFKLVFITLTIAFFGGVYGLINLKRLRTSFKWLTVYLLFSVLAQVLGYFVGQGLGSNQIYFIVVSPFYYLLVYLIFANFTKNKRILAINNILFAIGALFLFVFLAIDIHAGNTSDKSVSICNFLYSLASFIFFFDMLKAPIKKSPLKTPEFYFLFGFLFYHSAVIFFQAADALFVNEFNKLSLNYLHVAMLIIYYCTLSASLVVENKNNRLNGS